MQTQSDRTGKTLPSRGQVLEEVKQLVAEQVTLPVNEVREEHDLSVDLAFELAPAPVQDRWRHSR